MTDLLRIMLLVPLGYIAAIAAAALAVALSTARLGFGLGPVDVAVMAGALLFFVGATSFLFSLVAIAVAELFGIRSVFYFLIVGGAIGVLIHLFAPLAGPMQMSQRAVSFSAAGFIGGLVYWTIAGRLSGLGARQREDEAA